MSNKTPDIQLPKLYNLVVCESVIRDSKTNMTSLINIFNNIATTKFPFVMPKMFVFISVTEGTGKLEGELRLLNAKEIDKFLVALKGPMVFQNPRHTNNLVFEFQNITFPEPGEYIFEMLIENQQIGTRRFSVNLGR